jgi:hypothetical protein
MLPFTNQDEGEVSERREVAAARRYLLRDGGHDAAVEQLNQRVE